MTNWVDIPGFEGFYEISTEGQVRSLDRAFVNKIGRNYRRRGRLMRIRLHDNAGHRSMAITLCKNGLVSTWSLAKLVLLSFVGPSREGQVAHARDRNPENCKLDNLEWTTLSNIQLTRADRSGITKQSLLSRMAKFNAVLEDGTLADKFTTVAEYRTYLLNLTRLELKC